MCGPSVRELGKGRTGDCVGQLLHIAKKTIDNRNAEKDNSFLYVNRYQYRHLISQVAIIDRWLGQNQETLIYRPLDTNYKR